MRPPKSLAECRTQATKDARTETGAKVLLSDCAARFAPKKANEDLSELDVRMKAHPTGHALLPN
jgi:hypothetical protein